MNHAETVRAAGKLIAALGGRACVTHQGPGPKRGNGYSGLWGTPGIPDLYVQLPRREGLAIKTPLTFWFEVKVGKDTLRPEQEAFIRREEASGGQPVLIGDIVALEAFLGISRDGAWLGYLVDTGALRNPGSLEHEPARPATAG